MQRVVGRRAAVGIERGDRQLLIAGQLDRARPVGLVGEPQPPCLLRLVRRHLDQGLGQDAVAVVGQPQRGWARLFDGEAGPGVAERLPAQRPARARRLLRPAELAQVEELAAELQRVDRAAGQVELGRLVPVAQGAAEAAAIGARLQRVGAVAEPEAPRRAPRAGGCGCGGGRRRGRRPGAPAHDDRHQQHRTAEQRRSRSARRLPAAAGSGPRPGSARPRPRPDPTRRRAGCRTGSAAAPRSRSGAARPGSMRARPEWPSQRAARSSPRSPPMKDRFTSVATRRPIWSNQISTRNQS